MKKETNTADGMQKADEAVKKTTTTPPKPQRKAKHKYNPNAILELELCFEISAYALSKQIEQKLENRQSEKAQEQIKRKISESLYRLKDSSSGWAFNGLVEYYCGESVLDLYKHKILLCGGVDTLNAVAKYSANQQNPDIAISPILNIQNDKSIIDVLHSGELYESVFDDVKVCYSHLSDEEQELAVHKLADIHTLFEEVERQILKNPSIKHREWLANTKKYLAQYTALVERHKKESVKPRVLTLHFLLEAIATERSEKSIFKNGIAECRFIAQIVGSTPDVVEKYIQHTNDTNWKYKWTEHKDTAIEQLKNMFTEISIEAIRDSVNKAISTAGESNNK